MGRAYPGLIPRLPVCRPKALKPVDTQGWMVRLPCGRDRLRRTKPGKRPQGLYGDDIHRMQPRRLPVGGARVSRVAKPVEYGLLESVELCFSILALSQRWRRPQPVA